MFGIEHVAMVNVKNIKLSKGNLNSGEKRHKSEKPKMLAQTPRGRKKEY